MLLYIQRILKLFIVLSRCLLRCKTGVVGLKRLTHLYLQGCTVTLRGPVENTPRECPIHKNACYSYFGEMAGDTLLFFYLFIFRKSPLQHSESDVQLIYS